MNVLSSKDCNLKNYKLIIAILVIGVIFRLFLTANGNFLFNMDNARDMVDVREMMVLHKWRFTGPTSAIEGLFNGPAWYYLLAVPFLISHGDPYGSILVQIILWVIGGFFLLKLVSRWGKWLMVPIGAVWVSSDYIVLANLYAFNPNPVTLLSPLFIYLLVEYLKTGKAWFGIAVWFLGGLFFNFEMNFGVFTPLIIFLSIIFTKNFRLMRQKWFWAGIAAFVLTLMPQVIFDLKHQFIMSKALLKHLSENSGPGLNIANRVQIISESFYNTFQATLMNHQLLTRIILVLSVPVIYSFFRKVQKDVVFFVSLIFVFVPFLGYLIMPVKVNPWHLGGEMAVSLILIAYLLKELIGGRYISKIVAVVLTALVVWFSLFNLGNFFVNDFGKQNADPSLFKNEIAAIDYVYKYAKGKNFKAYVFMPSIYDYPYQYLFWWYGNKKYGYIPFEYAYNPNEYLYISNKDKFNGSKDNYEGLVFLIKEPNRGRDWRSGWEGKYKTMELVFSDKIGSIEIEVRREIKK